MTSMIKMSLIMALSTIEGVRGFFTALVTKGVEVQELISKLTPEVLKALEEDEECQSLLKLCKNQALSLEGLMKQADAVFSMKNLESLTALPTTMRLVVFLGTKPVEGVVNYHISKLPGRPEDFYGFYRVLGGSAEFTLSTEGVRKLENGFTVLGRELVVIPVREEE